MSEPHALLINTGSRNCKLTLLDATGATVQKWQLEGQALPGAPQAWLASLDTPVNLTVHRLVHGGTVLAEPAWWSPALDQALAPLDALAPLHNPPARGWAQACARRWPQARHCLIPDTGLFSALPAVTRTLPLPRALREQYQLCRYGFHGLAHSSLSRQLFRQEPALAQGRVITLQLGGGCSATAFRSGRPVETSMGFTPLAGLVMATRCGDLDPGVLLHLLRSGMTADQIEQVLVHESGLKGLSELSGDMRELLAAHTEAAALAIEQFCHRIRHYIGAYAAALGGLDGLVFGGGIGEHAACLREKICSPLGFLGITLDVAINRSARGPTRISRAHSCASVWVMPADEEAEMLRQARQSLEET